MDESRAERFRRMFVKRIVNQPEKIMHEAAASYRKVYTASARLVPGAKELLDNLKDKVKIGVVTNNLISEQKSKIKECRIEKYIDVLVTSEEVGVTKPHPLIFQTALDKLNVRADEVIMVGDKWDVDIVGARNLDIKCIWINVFGTLCQDKDIAIEAKSLKQAKKIINDLIYK